MQGTALGKCPKEKLFKGYIELELEVRPMRSYNLSIVTIARITELTFAAARI